MLLDYQVDPSSRACCQTGRRLAPGERYYSALVAKDGQVVRRDYSQEAWKGPKSSWIGWWEAAIPDRSGGKRRLAPDDVLLNLLTHLEDQPEEQEFRYLIALLLLRRRTVRLEETSRDTEDREQMELTCPTRGEQYAVLVADPDTVRIEQLQNRLAGLLDADASAPSQVDPPQE